MTRCRLAHTRFIDQYVKRRWTVCQEAPKTGGSCRQVHPDVATKMIAAGDSAVITSTTAPTPHTSWWLRRHVQEDLPQPIGHGSFRCPMLEQRLNANQESSK